MGVSSGGQLNSAQKSHSLQFRLGLVHDPEGQPPARMPLSIHRSVSQPASCSTSWWRGPWTRSCRGRTSPPTSPSCGSSATSMQVPHHMTYVLCVLSSPAHCHDPVRVWPGKLSGSLYQSICQSLGLGVGPVHTASFMKSCKTPHQFLCGSIDLVGVGLEDGNRSRRSVCVCLPNPFL